MSSFIKVSGQKQISGTRTSLQNGQIITSSGNPSLDFILGGGIPLGSILLIEEDKFAVFSRILAKYFLAEGICSGHSLLFGSLDDDVHELVKNLPKAIEDVSSDTTITKTSSPAESISYELNEKVDEMRIAWRYQNLPKVNSEQSTKIGHNFNLLEKIDENTLKSSDIKYWHDDEDDFKPAEIQSRNVFKNLKYNSFLQTFSTLSKSEKFSIQSSNSVSNRGDDNDLNANKSVLRTCITSLGSPLWYDNDFIEDFIKFLTILKSIVRNCQSVCFLTIPMHLMALLDDYLVHRIRSLVDFSIELESFASSDKETNPAFKEYNGLLTIKKISAINCLAAFTPETTDLAFKLRRKKFVIEKLHLPPELGDTEQREQDDITPSLSCGSSKKHLLEF